MTNASTGAPGDLGAVYTRGASFRARAEARQREYRARVLRAGWSWLGHILDEESAAAGKNFLTSAIHDAARERARRKGVAPQTFDNMLASQAMCFNLFAPLAADLDLAGAVLGPLLDLATVRAIAIEHTPARDIFGDQSGRGGVDCDVLIDATARDGAAVLVTIETKFVEPDFSVCGFRNGKRLVEGRPFCPDDTPVRTDRAACLYASLKGYAYWKRTDEFGTLAPDALPERGCAFAGSEWQLWVNHTLAHAEAARRDAARATFAVCAAASNDALLGDGILDRFRARLASPQSFRFVSLDVLIDRITEVSATRGDDRREWARGLAARYGRI
ncbi:MAG: hypothetical protein M3Y87_29185 [Myxococcota bacterium]|nr:hypothetical protein [Myxococcota bacterium]